MIFREHSLTSKGFSWDAAVSLVNACRLAYGTEGAIRHGVAEGELGLKQLFSFGATQGYFAEGRHVVVCTYRGTDSTADWVANLNTARVTQPYGTVHRGFLTAYLTTAALVRGHLARAKASGKAFWLTGHSLGGALAQVAALDLAGSYDRIGLYTFGQPRTANVEPSHHLHLALGLDYHRVVNGSDYVTRIPRNFGHAGRLVRVGTATETLGDEVGEPGEVDLPPIGEAELAEDQARIRALKAEIDAAERVDAQSDTESIGPPVDRDRLLDASTEGFLPGIRDHAIGTYARNIAQRVTSESRRFQATTEILRNLSSSRLRSVARPDTQPRRRGRSRGAAIGTAPEDAEIFARRGPPMGLGVDAAEDAAPGVAPPGGPEALIPVLVQTRSDAWQPGMGARVQSRIGRFVTLLVPGSGIDALQNDPDLVSIELSRDAGIAELDRSLPYIKGDEVQRPPMAETGDAALVGLVDSGIDILHKAFLGADGRTRIRAIWNQRDQRGPSPNAVDPGFPQDTGTLLNGADIQARIDAFEADGTEPHWMLRDGGKGHGTHVAGIAAGRATALCGPGMAPGAGVLAVIPNMMTAEDDPQSLGYSVSHLAALAFLKQAARGGNAAISGPGLPIAINISLGMNAGAHDGSTLLEAAIDATTGGGADPGIVLVKSAGNERGLGGHAATSLVQGLTDIVWASDDVDRDVDYFEGWFDNADDLSFMLTNPMGNSLAQVSLVSRTASEVLDGNLCQMELTRLVPDNGHSRIVVTVSPRTEPIRRGEWRLTIQGNDIRTATGAFDLWVEHTDLRAVRFLRDAEETTLSIPGTANHILTVAASDTGAMPRLTGSSSFGLTRDGRAKPDLAAPGLGVISARANDADREAVGPMTGTSHSAPHVTGALALAMSRRAKSGKPQFNARQLSRAAIATSRKLSPLHHKGFGHGILDARALLDLLDQEP